MKKVVLCTNILSFILISGTVADQDLSIQFDCSS